MNSIAVYFTKIRKSLFVLSTLLSFLFINNSVAQTFKGISLFQPKDVRLLESDFLNAQEVDLKYILSMQPNRLLYPFLREAGLDPKADSYPNWENTGLDGHIGGHYLSALSLMYASTGNKEVKSRLDLMLSELKRCQDANEEGYIGGVPGSLELWNTIKTGKIDASGFSLNGRWVPLYNIHKTYAGLLDAYRYAESELAKNMLLEYTDWMISLTQSLNQKQIQTLLISEHGGLNEVFAELAEISGEEKHLKLAQDFSDLSLLEPLCSQKDMLNGMHANTQIPKVIGFEAIADISGDRKYHDAAKFFWDNVVNKRTVAIGGNSVREHFHPVSDFSSMINSNQGPETCNTYNMLKLSKMLFKAEGDESYIDYYEQGLYNHILSSQHPEKGGFVYFTPMRPGHYRVYSQPETSFWCCVGSGLENHAKYNELIYAHDADELYVNLFIPSVMEWKKKGVKIKQLTQFPEKESTTLLIETDHPQTFSFKLRYPSWVKEGQLEILVNGENVKFKASPGSYVKLRRKWNNSDKVEMKLPMEISSERLPDGSNYAALKYGPIVLAVLTGKEGLDGLFADDSRGGHIANGELLALGKMPMFVTENPENISQHLTKIENKALTFSASEIVYPDNYKELEFIPFYKLHDARYAIYLPLETHQSLEEIQLKLRKQELRERRLDALTIDYVAPGEQQPESDHFIKSKNSNTGVNKDRHWRDAEGWFSYQLRDESKKARKLRVTYYGTDDKRKFKILLNGFLLAEENLKAERGDNFFELDYEIPNEIKQNSKENLKVRFEAYPNSKTAGIYGVRLIK